ncbi:MAG TPA: hypothetical protein VFT17_06250, partial [Propionibacteriaceae bacterium]|nr:hypothetical protein [Propionibacteriaceae bacterium]
TWCPCRCSANNMATPEQLKRRNRSATAHLECRSAAASGARVGSSDRRRVRDPLDPLAAYAQFCQNNPTLCVSTTPTALRDIGYIQFCQNSPALCTVAKPC